MIRPRNDEFSDDYLKENHHFSRLLNLLKKRTSQQPLSTERILSVAFCFRKILFAVIQRHTGRETVELFSSSYAKFRVLKSFCGIPWNGWFVFSGKYLSKCFAYSYYLSIWPCKANVSL